ncbi:MAG: redox-regulated ATPase YchF [Candidatus Dojkabacteria bacterium]
MGLSLGIVGMPNVGKSTLFNSLTSNEIPAENYPFCTIDPNVGVVEVADERIAKLAKIVNSSKQVNAVIEYYDIAGLVRGAHRGEGLGNEFLGHIRITDAIVHVLRDFVSDDVAHVEKRIDPREDREIIETELILKDIATIEKKIESLNREVRKDKKLIPFLDHLQELMSALSEGELARSVNTHGDGVIANRQQLFLLTDKPVIFVINGDWENITTELGRQLREKIGIEDEYPVLPLNIKIEAELAQLNDAEREEFKQELGLKYSGLEQLTRESYKLLNLMTFFTAGQQETRAWTVKNNSTAPEAAGVIHTDFQKNFIAAEVLSYSDFVEYGGWLGAREHGKVRLEGRGYVVREGDVMNFRHGA